MKVLHLIDPGSPGGGACTLRLLADVIGRLRSVDSDVLVIGNRAEADLARRCSVPVTGTIGAPIRVPSLARRDLSRAMEFYERAQGRYDIVHAWTLPTASLAALVAGSRRQVVSLALGPAGGWTTTRAVARLGASGTPMFAASPAIEEEFLSIGANASSLSVLPTAINPDSIESPPRAELRARWATDDETFVIGLLSEPAGWCDARSAMNVLLRVAATGRKTRLIIDPSARRRVEVEHWATRLGRRELMTIDEETAEPWRVINGLDASLLIGGDLDSVGGPPSHSPLALLAGSGHRLQPQPGITPLLWAMSAGVPVIAEASRAVCDVIEDGQTGLLVGRGDLNAASDRINRLHDDPTIGGRIGLNSREHVRRNFHVSAYCVRLKDVYSSVTGGAASGRGFGGASLDGPLDGDSNPHVPGAETASTSDPRAASEPGDTASLERITAT